MIELDFAAAADISQRAKKLFGEITGVAFTLREMRDVPEDWPLIPKVLEALQSFRKPVEALRLEIESNRTTFDFICVDLGLDSEEKIHKLCACIYRVSWHALLSRVSVWRKMKMESREVYTLSDMLEIVDAWSKWVNDLDVRHSDIPLLDRLYDRAKVFEYNQSRSGISVASTGAAAGPAGTKPAKGKKKKRAAGESEGTELCRAALLKHHNYLDELVTDRATLGKLAELSSASKPTVSRFICSYFGSFKGYVRACEEEEVLKEGLSRVDRGITLKKSR